MSSTADRLRDLTGRGLLILFGLWALVIHAGGLGLAPLVILMGAMGWALWVVRSNRHYEPLLALWLLAVFFLWMIVTSLWGGPGPLTALRLGLLSIIVASVPLLIRSQSERTLATLSHILMASAIAGVAIIAIDVGSGYALNTLIDPVGADGDLNLRQGDAERNTGQGLLAYAMFTPFLIALFATRLKRDLAIVAIVLFLFGLFFAAYLNRLVIPALILGGAAPLFYLAFRAPKLAQQLSVSIAVLSILFAPLVGMISRLAPEGLLNALPMSWDHRLRMWNYALAKVQERPLLGHGLDSSRLMQESFTTRIGVDVPFISLHPHNIGLQTWMELGAVGALLLTFTIVKLSSLLSDDFMQSPWRSGAMAGTITAVSLAGMVTVGAWQYWWWAAALLPLFLVPLIPTRLENFVR